nr:PREDICTED: uncharacterized protein LOC107079475 [Lepisosteus oculatus]
MADLPDQEVPAAPPQSQNQPFTARTMRQLNAETIYATDSPRTHNLKTLRAKRLAYFAKTEKPKSGGASEHISSKSLSDLNKASDVKSIALKYSSKSLEKKDDSIYKQPTDGLICLNNETAMDGQCFPGECGETHLDHGLLQDSNVPENQKLRHVLSWAQKFINIRNGGDNNNQRHSEGISGRRFPQFLQDNESECLGTSSQMIRDSNCVAPRIMASKKSQAYDFKHTVLEEETLNNVIGQENHKWMHKDFLHNVSKPSSFMNANDSLDEASADRPLYSAFDKSDLQETQKEKQIFLLSDLQGMSPKHINEGGQSGGFDFSERELTRNTSTNNCPKYKDISFSSSDHSQFEFRSLLQDEFEQKRIQEIAGRARTSTRLSKESDFDECHKSNLSKAASLEKATVINWQKSTDVPEYPNHKMTDAKSRWYLQFSAWDNNEHNDTTPAGHTLANSCCTELSQENMISNPKKDLKEIPGLKFCTKSLKMDGTKDKNEEMKINSQICLERDEIKYGRTRDVKEQFIFHPDCDSENVITDMKKGDGLVRFCPDCSRPNDSDINWCTACGCALIGIVTRPYKEHSEIHNTPVCDVKSTSKNYFGGKTRIQRTNREQTNPSFEDFGDIDPISSSLFDIRSDVSVYDKYITCVQHLNNIKIQHNRERRELNNGRDSDQKEMFLNGCVNSVTQNCANYENKTSHGGGMLDTEIAVPQQKDSMNKTLPKDNNVNVDETRNLGMTFSSVGMEADVKITEPVKDTSVEQAAEHQAEYVLENDFDLVEKEKGSRAQTSNKLKGRKMQEIKPKRSQNIDLSLAGSKRYWEKSSIAWSSYNSGELKPRSTLTGRPLSAEKCRPSTCQACQQEATSIEAHHSCKGLEEHVFKRPLSAGATDTTQASLLNIQNASETHKRHAWMLPKDTKPNTLIDFRKQKDQTGDAAHFLWLVLPDELWIYILSMISHKDLCQAAQVCHRLRCLANDKTLWQTVRIENCICLNDTWLSNIGRHCPKSLTLYRCQSESITDKGLDDLFRQCKYSLKELSVTSCSGPRLSGDSVLLHCTAHCIQLTSVDISWTGATDMGVLSLVNSCNRLQSLSINGCQMTDDALKGLVKRHGKSLNRLEAFGCHALSAKSMSSLADQCPNLRVLNIGQMPKITDVCLTHMIPCFKHLTSINVTGINVVRDRTVHCIVKHCSKLESLTLSSCPCITDVSLVEVSTYLPTIRYFDVSGCRKVTDTGVQAITLTCRHLQYLDLSSTRTGKRGVCLLANYCYRSLECVKLSFCKDVSEDAVKKLCKNCKRLKLLHLFGCHGIHNVKGIREVNQRIEVHYDLSINTSFLKKI